CARPSSEGTWASAGSPRTVSFETNSPAGSTSRSRRTAPGPHPPRPLVNQPFNPALSHLECFDCGARADLSTPRSTCPACGRPLVARYDLARIRAEVPRESLGRYGTDLWRYRVVLPFAPSFPAVRLGEGGTPLLPLPRLAETLGMDALWMK